MSVSFKRINFSSNKNASIFSAKIVVFSSFFFSFTNKFHRDDGQCKNVNFIIRYASPDLALNRILVSFASMRRWTGSSGLRSGPFSYLLSTSDTRAVWFTSKYHISFYFFVIYISLRSFFDRSTLYYDRSFLNKRR